MVGLILVVSRDLMYCRKKIEDKQRPEKASKKWMALNFDDRKTKTENAENTIPNVR